MTLTQIIVDLAILLTSLTVATVLLHGVTHGKYIHYVSMGLSSIIMFAVSSVGISIIFEYIHYKNSNCEFKFSHQCLWCFICFAIYFLLGTGILKDFFISEDDDYENDDYYEEDYENYEEYDDDDM
jgi:hypothetical protein